MSSNAILEVAKLLAQETGRSETSAFAVAGDYITFLRSGGAVMPTDINGAALVQELRLRMCAGDLSQEIELARSLS